MDHSPLSIKKPGTHITANKWLYTDEVKSGKNIFSAYLTDLWQELTLSQSVSSQCPQKPLTAWSIRDGEEGGNHVPTSSSSQALRPTKTGKTNWHHLASTKKLVYSATFTLNSCVEQGLRTVNRSVYVRLSFLYTTLPLFPQSLFCHFVRDWKAILPRFPPTTLTKQLGLQSWFM